MIVLVVSRVTPALRGTLSRWLLEVHAGVFVGHVSTPVRDRLWAMVQGRRRLGACTLISRAPNEQGFTITSSGDTRRSVVDYDGLALIRVANKISDSARAGSKTTVNPMVDWQSLWGPSARLAAYPCGADGRSSAR